MVPDKFNMVDMDGIDLIMMQGEEVPGLYNRLVESIAQCRYQCLYNWFFDGVPIPPSYIEMEVNEDDEVAINEGITVSSDDVIHIYSVEPGPVEPEIIPLLAEENGVYNVPAGKDGFNPVTVDVPIYTPVIDPITITENGTYAASSGVDGYSPVSVNVPSAPTAKGFEVYAANGDGGPRTEHGFLNNNYFVCFFDDNMSSTYTLNGVSARYSTITTGKQQILAATRDVVNPSITPVNALLPGEGSVFTASHGDSGSFISVVGGWVGYSSGGAIYEHAAVGTSNSVTLNSAHETLLIFIGADSNTSGITTVDINGDTYTIENIGDHYGAYGMYTAIEISGNSDTNITVTFPASCWSYVSIIGLN